MRIRSSSRWFVWTASFAALIGVTAAMVAVRERLNAAHVALAYLIVVQLASVRGGRALGLSLAVTSFLAFNWFFLPPYGTFAIANPIDWFVLVAFLITSIIAAELLYRAQALGAERERLEATTRRARSLEETNRSKDAVLAAVSHDLRTPLTTIKGLAHEIADAGDERAEIIEEEADRLNAFVGKLLDFSRVTMGTAALDVQPNEAEDLLGAAAQQVQGRLDAHPLVLHVEPSDGMLFGAFDFVQTLRVLVNLIDNAAQAMLDETRERKVTVTTATAGDQFELAVEDTGCGIPPDILPKVFEPLFSTKSFGTGLGLPVVKQIIEQHGGTIDITSEIGKGPCVVVRLKRLAENRIAIAA
jgi:two-component system sensor histidine kinase KdpD